MKIIIETIPHRMMEYPTCGDWRFDADGTLVIKVSEEIGPASAGLVAIHELAEVFMCFDGFRMSKKKMQKVVETVDKFDKEYDADLADEEPGDDPKAPYHIEHSIATAIERILCAKLGIAWSEHDDRVAKLF